MRDEDRRDDPGGTATIGERLTGVRDPRDPDGLLTIEQDADRPDPAAYGTKETDTLEREQEHFAEVRSRHREGELPKPPRADGVTGRE